MDAKTPWLFSRHSLGLLPGTAPHYIHLDWPSYTFIVIHFGILSAGSEARVL